MGCDRRKSKADGKNRKGKKNTVYPIEKKVDM